MKLGAAYNLFDGEELLEYSINSIRSCVDYIVVVYQDTSNFGNKSKSDLEKILTDLRNRGLIDEFIQYSPNLIQKGHGNEIMKRNIGLERCKHRGCTHFMTIDCDEFYKADELNFAKAELKDGYDSSACLMQTYYKSPEYALDPPEIYYVPLIYKIDERSFTLSKQWPVLADPTRKLDPKNLMIFDRGKIQMHHMSYVRSDLRIKLENSSANTNFKDKIDHLVGYWNAWQPHMPAMLAGKEERIMNLKQVDNYFGINIK